MKNTIENQETDSVEVTTPKLTIAPEQLFRMISPTGFTNVISEITKGAKYFGIELTQKQAFEFCNNEFQNLTGKPRYKNFQSFKKSCLS